jgi:hydroxymethylglutaryl-CoA lyase
MLFDNIALNNIGGKTMKHVEIIEVAPRDGWQSIKKIIPTELKIDIIERMFATGISKIQSGSFVSPRLIPQMADVKELIKILLPKYTDKRLFVLVPNFIGAKYAIESGLKEISLVISVSESHNKANVHYTVSESLEQLKKIRDSFPNIHIGIDVATAFGCPFEGETSLGKLLAFLRRVVCCGVDEVTLCDTIGVAYPTQIAEYIKVVRSEFRDLQLSIHIHDTRNMGIVNTYTAIQSGIERVQTSLGGLGGCPYAPGASGNTATEDLVYMLHKCGFDTGIDFKKLMDTACYMKSVIEGNYSGHHLAINNNCSRDV